MTALDDAFDLRMFSDIDADRFDWRWESCLEQSTSTRDRAISYARRT